MATVSTSERHRRPRADGLRNRARVLSAAEEAFGSSGSTVSLDDIARRAGVGAGTVHRHFATKDELLAAVIIERLKEMTEIASALADAEDPGPAFIEFFRRLTAAARNNIALSTTLHSPQAVADVERGRDTLRNTLGLLLERAQRSGNVRPDLTPSDVQAMVIGVVAMEKYLGRDPEERSLEVMIRGIDTGCQSLAT